MISRDKIACANSFSFLEGYNELMEILGNMILNRTKLYQENKNRRWLKISKDSFDFLWNKIRNDLNIVSLRNEWLNVYV